MDGRLREMVQEWLVGSGKKSQEETLALLRDKWTQRADGFGAIAGRSHLSLRSLAWKFALNIGKLSADEYVALVTKGESRAYDKIRKDTHRTDGIIAESEQERELSRLLNAYVISKGTNESNDYFQGMNDMAAIFLLVMPELDAFFCFRKMLIDVVPQYYKIMREGDMTEGMTQGMRLVDLLIAAKDPDLWNHLHALLRGQPHVGACKVLYAKYVLNFMANLTDRPEAVLLWDFFFLFGFHMNIFCVAAFFLENKERLMSGTALAFINSHKKGTLAVNARTLTAKAVMFVATLSTSNSALFDAVCAHTLERVDDIDSLADELLPKL